jgi:uncharacterized repeat protein (TIGR01451 family)
MPSVAVRTERYAGVAILLLALLAGGARLEAQAARPGGQAPRVARTPPVAGAGGGIATFETGQRPAVEIHVATTGDDATGDGSAGNPFRTIARGVQELVPGAAVRIHAGTYPGRVNVSDLSGTAEAPIWIGGVEGEARPVIEDASEGIHLTRVRYLVVHDLEVRQTDDNGINCDDGGDYANPDATRHVVFRDLYVHDVGGTGNQDCLKLSGVDDYYVLDSEFTRCGGGTSGSGIDHVGCHGGLIVGNTFHDLSANAVQCKGGSRDIEIRANRMVNAGARAVNIGGSTGFTYFRPPLSTSEPNYEARDIRIAANVIEGSEAPLAFVGCVECVAANNTIVDPTNWLLRILQETTTSGGYEFLPCSHNTVVNNLFYFDRDDLSAYRDINIGPNTEPETFAFSNNLWYAHDAPAESDPDLPVAETDGIIGQDPLLVDPSSGDYRPRSGSPAIGSGTAVAWVTHDYDGNPYNAPPSVGAFEGNPTIGEAVSKAASTTDARHGDLITYTVAIADLGAPPTVTHALIDRVPAGLSYVPDSLVASGGTVDDAGAPLLRWTGLLTPTPSVTVTYAVTVSTLVPQWATNTAVVGAPGYRGITRTATVRLNVMRVYLPLTLRSGVR